jgi:hypothetical protein
VKILEFELAKLTEPASQGPEDAILTEVRLAEAAHTDAGSARRCRYMSPEQAEAKR